MVSIQLGTASSPRFTKNALAKTSGKRLQYVRRGRTSRSGQL